MSGKLAYLQGVAAENRVLRLYQDQGYILIARRWRGPAGEIDLIFEKHEEIVFVEVKQRRDFARAAQSLAPAQLRRLQASAQHCLGFLPNGQDSACRIDLAMVNRLGETEIVANVTMN